MFTSDSIFSLQPYSKYEINSVFIQNVKDAQNEFYQKFARKKDGTPNNYLEAKNASLYKHLAYMPIKISLTAINQHQDLANFRLYFEWELITRNFKLVNGIINAMIIDVGASTRLANALIARVALRPQLDVQDYVRTYKFNAQTPCLVMNLTFQEFLTKYKNQIREYAPVFNFTDVLYYISDIELANNLSYFDDGIIGMGTMHIFKQNILNPVQELLNLGYITQEQHKIYMKVVGNETTYQHKTRFNVLLNHDNYNIVTPNCVLTIIKQNSVDLGVTLYTSFLIVKSQDTQYSKSMPHSLDIEEFVTDEQKESEFIDKMISKAIEDYLTNQQLTYEQVKDSNFHKRNIRLRLNVNYPEEKIYSKINALILKLFINNPNV